MLIDAFVNQMLLSHEFVIRIFAVAMEVEDGLTFVLEFFNILTNASIHLIKFLVAFLPCIENDGFEKLFILRVRFDGLQELNEFLLKPFLWHGFCVRTLCAAVMVIRIAFALVTARVASGEWLIAMLTQNEPPQRKVRIVKHARLAFEMASALHVLTLGEQRIIDDGFEVAFFHPLECIDSATIHRVCDDFFERLL